MVPGLHTRYVSAAVITHCTDTEHGINFRIQTGLSRRNTHAISLHKDPCCHIYITYSAWASLDQANLEKTTWQSRETWSFLKHTYWILSFWGDPWGLGALGLATISPADFQSSLCTWKSTMATRSTEFTTMTTGRTCNSLLCCLALFQVLNSIAVAVLLRAFQQ